MASRTGAPPIAPRLSVPARPSPKAAPKTDKVDKTDSKTVEMLSPPVEAMVKPAERVLSDGTDLGLKRVSLLNPRKVKTFSDLAEAMAGTTAGGRDLGKAVEVVKAMRDDKYCLVVLTLTGNATPFTVLIAELIDKELIQCVVSTGAICTHSFSAERGKPLLQVDDPDAVDDNAFYNKGLNRIYDTVELETSLNEGYDALHKITDKLDPSEPVTSSDIMRLIGEYLIEKYPKSNGLLHAAARKKVPIFIPSFSDSEIGLDFHGQNLEREDKGKPSILFDAFADWKQYCALVKFSKSLGIITLGGGAPRNWAQQVGPFFDIMTEKGLAPKGEPVRFKYGVRICTASNTEAGLSGCHFHEGRSWGKFMHEDQGGMFAEIVGDYTLAFPLICQAVLEDTKS